MSGFVSPSTSPGHGGTSYLAGWRSSARRPRFYLAATGVMCVLLVSYALFSQRFTPEHMEHPDVDFGIHNPPPPPPSRPPPPDHPEPPSIPVIPIVAVQSRTLGQARSRYALRHNRAPPPGYDEWFHWAQEKKCLIDEYQQVYRDFEPFYQIAETNRTHFLNMIRRGVDVINVGNRPTGLANITIRGGEALVANDRTYFDNEWRDRIRNFVHFLPDMEILFNGNDEPRVVFDTSSLETRARATEIHDETPFEIKPKYTNEFFRNQSGCSGWTTEAGFGSSLEDIAFIASSSSSGFTTDFWPMLSFTKVHPCFSDILFPSQYHYASSWYSGKISEPNDIEWAKKEPKLYWRGSSNGGHIVGQNYHNFPRFRLVTIGNAHPDIMDTHISGFWGSHCTYECEARPIEEEYDIGDQWHMPREAVHRFRYVLDVDGNTFSGRYLGLLKSGSLVFKTTGFTEYFSDWLRPYEHYIPVKVDLSDLVDRVRWAIDNDDEAKRIQQAGQRFAEEVITDEQNDCYFAAVLLEWARLQRMAEEV
ncbi:glycosyl transferase family 90-domain-containing protein [Roridomyces roridus]|uniref:Glycosyl transferase family 90-domain-containing protein n=1 Tax=Roridomyces roridus TaxID=1738132 RepID=A0AAD7B808_9AGAR|nr:glycosyl transferase family 90-domain-containing protein [Roridomyces roridus]